MTGMEVLEPRLLLAADVVISEIMYQSFTESGLPEDYSQEYAGRGQQRRYR